MSCPQVWHAFYIRTVSNGSRKGLITIFMSTIFAIKNISKQWFLKSIQDIGHYSSTVRVMRNKWEFLFSRLCILSTGVLDFWRSKSWDLCKPFLMKKNTWMVFETHRAEIDSSAANALMKMKIGGIFPKIASHWTIFDSLIFNFAIIWLLPWHLAKKSSNR